MSMRDRRVLSKLLAFVAATTVLLVAVPQFRAADTIPAAISDANYWKMIEEFSEDGGFFTSENFSSNERGYQTLIPKLQAIVKPGGVYLGVGPEQNFQYIASLKPKIAFIIDIRRQNMIQHLMYKAAFEMSSTRADFLSIIFSRKRPAELSEDANIYQLLSAYGQAEKDDEFAEANRKTIKDILIKAHGFKLSIEDEATIDHVFDVFSVYGTALNYSSNIDGLGNARPARGGGNNIEYGELMGLVDENGVNRSYLASEQSFRYIKEMQQKNLVIPIVGNFGGPKAIRSVAQYLTDHGAIVGAFYLSNVEQYLFRPPQGGPSIDAEFYENVSALPVDDSSTFIRSGNGPVQAGRGNLTPMMSSILHVLTAYREGRIRDQRDVLLMSIP